jgi:hypothetical protein
VLVVTLLMSRGVMDALVLIFIVAALTGMYWLPNVGGATDIDEVESLRRHSLSDEVPDGIDGIVAPSVTPNPARQGLLRSHYGKFS